MKRNGRLPLNSENPVGGAHDGRTVVLGLDVRVARGRVAQQAHRRAQPLARGGEQAHRGGRAHGDEGLEIAPVDDEGLEVLLDEGRRRARAAVEEGDLAEKLSRGDCLERDVLARVVLEEELDDTRPHDVERAARIAVPEHLRARHDPLDVDARREHGSVPRRQVMEEGNLGEDVDVGGQRRSWGPGGRPPLYPRAPPRQRLNA